MTTPATPRTLLTLARVLIAALFLVAGARKLLSYAGTLGYFTQLGIPLPELALPLTIFIELAGGAALVAGWRLHLVAPVMAVFTLVTAFAGHRFWAADPAQFSGQLNHFLKNIAIVGAFISMAVQARTEK